MLSLNPLSPCIGGRGEGNGTPAFPGGLWWSYGIVTNMSDTFGLYSHKVNILVTLQQSWELTS